MAKLGFTIGLIVLFGALSLISSIPAVSTTEEVRWSQEAIPVEGEAGDWLPADGSGVGSAMA